MAEKQIETAGEYAITGVIALKSIGYVALFAIFVAGLVL